MSYLVFARKYRPLGFDGVSGQPHVTRTLQNAIRRDRIGHAYLLAGPRGVGKTSIARIFAKALNCEKGPTPDPCLVCTNCKEISHGTSLSVREIDGASHNSVENVRELIENFRSLPPPGATYKVYIIDEVHMLSTAAFNALLKSLEEPPRNTVFILATTELHKIPETVISRCQKHELRALTPEIVFDQLQMIVREEKLTADPIVLRMIARLADGSMRDAQSLLDRVVSFCDGDITEKEASKVLGVVERRVLFSLSESTFARDPSNVLSLLSEIFSSSIDTALLLKDFVSHFRELSLAKFGGEKALKAYGVPDFDITELNRQTEGVDSNDLQDLARLAREGADTALRSFYPKYAFEAVLVRMATREPVKDIQQILANLEGAINSDKGLKDDSSLSVPKIERKGVRPPMSSSSISSSAVSSSSAASLGATTNSGSLDWPTFVRDFVASESRMLLEHVKRLRVTKFSAGELVAVGPSFSISSLKRADLAAKFLDILKKQSPSIQWKVDLKPESDAADNVEKTSLQEIEKKEAASDMETRTKNAAEHPSIRNLKQAFPGSKIESIRVKE